MRCQGFLILLACLLQAGSADKVRAQGTPSSQPLQSLYEALSDRHQRSNPIWVRFHTDSFESSDYQKLLSNGKDSAERSYRFEGEFARNGVKTRSWGKYDHPPEYQWLGEMFFIFNGEISIHPLSQANIFSVSKTPDTTVVEDLPTMITGEDILREQLETWKQNKGSVANVETKQETSQDREPLLLISWTYSRSGFKCKCWVSPSADWFIKRFEEYFPNGQLANSYESSEYETGNAVFYPTRGTRTRHLKTGQLAAKTLFALDSIETRSSRIPDTLFQYEIPAGCQIWDDDLKTMVRDTDLTESHLAEVIRRLGPHPQVWRQWGLVLLIGLACSLGAWYGIRVLRRPSRLHK
jgi:hypothetical protein